MPIQTKQSPSRSSWKGLLLSWEDNNAIAQKRPVGASLRSQLTKFCLSPLAKGLLSSLDLPRLARLSAGVKRELSKKRVRRLKAALRTLLGS